ncbi:hypothetical protein PtA15_7A46 [Puccinia triticina]|uniref:Uncharacterized protein n=1 Tax=Puccinia triticina TaxID=208348 RepID=A0ABY7CML8_9BASI|nr:uncharacterized protein PtA15_7A46 [Puccinia triticina]WAQ86320.1 hypothetical protein PtA15_7A46 [Puccinia triticina]WAR56198.1 hypothetical protein PtB15_7B43 [Puccinia triticina]WAR56208.1 hypothetical protein PtB15_7B53 [Puccinia triticina]
MSENSTANPPGEGAPNGGASNANKDESWITRLVDVLVPRFQTAGGDSAMQTDVGGKLIHTPTIPIRVVF